MDNYTSDSSDSENNSKVLDFAYLLLEPETVEKQLDIEDQKKIDEIESIILHHNQLARLPKNLAKFTNIKVLDVSSNGLEVLPDVFKSCPIATFIAKNNRLEARSLPKSFTNNGNLKELNLSGNLFEQIPEQIFDLTSLKYLYLGGNKVRTISKNIQKLTSLQIFSVGGNELVEVPSALGRLKYLQALVLCDNRIESLPSHIANLHNLRSLLLHKNKLRTLPLEIVALKNLTELSLRENPLVGKFVNNIKHNTTTLKELSARVIKLHDIEIREEDIPVTLIEYLNTGHRCVNSNCRGVFFDNRVEHVKFVDFCGKYRLPLLQYLCSTRCMTEEDEDFNPSRAAMMKKVLLG